MSKKSKGMLTVFSVCAVIFLTVFAARNLFIGNKYRTNLEYTYSRAIGDLSESLEKMHQALEKSEFCSTPTMQLQLSASVISSGSAAKTAAASLPFSADRSAKIEKLLSVCQDYALYTAKKISAGSSFSQDDFDNFKSMSEYVGNFSSSLADIREKLEKDNTPIGPTETLLNSTLNVPDTPSFDAGLENFSEELDSFPTMLYDGPFSDHIVQMHSLYLEDMEEISSEEAIEKAAQFLQVNSGNLSCQMETQGSLEGYQIRGSGLSANVTKKGGKISWAKRSVDVPDTKMTYEEALEKAKEFLSRNDLGPVKESYYTINDNTCTINFSAVDKGVIMYPDLIKVTVELNQGGIIEYNAEGYLMNHHDRENLKPALSEKEAVKKISSSLKIKNCTTAVIPTSGKNEVLTYEFTCESSDGTEVLVYINGETGFEQQVYILRRADNGVFVY